MWIMLNNRPLDISKIEGISEVITLDSNYYVRERNKDANNLFYKSEVDFNKMNLPKELCMTPDKVLIEDANNLNKVWGYFFYIRELTAIQYYSNRGMNGVNYVIERRYSKVYSTKEAAQAALDHLLFEMNEIYNKLVKVEI